MVVVFNVITGLLEVVVVYLTLSLSIYIYIDAR